MSKAKAATIAIVVPVCVGAVLLAAAVYLLTRKHVTAVKQRRFSHRDSSMPTVGVKEFVAARNEEV